MESEVMSSSYNVLVGVAFWFFIASVVVAFIWFVNTQGRELQKTIRMAIEKGVPLETIRMQKRGNDIMGFYIGGIITSAVGIGLSIMGYVFGQSNPKAFAPLMGPGVLVLIIGLSLLICGWMISHKGKERDL